MAHRLIHFGLAGMAARAVAQTTVGTTFGFTPTADCTMTVVTTTGAPLPPMGWQPVWYFTKHTTTTTTTEEVDCGGCARLLTASLIISFYYPDPPRHIEVDVTAVEPDQATAFRCKATPSFSLLGLSPSASVLTGLPSLSSPQPVSVLPPALPVAPVESIPTSLPSVLSPGLAPISTPALPIAPAPPIPILPGPSFTAVPSPVLVDAVNLINERPIAAGPLRISLITPEYTPVVAAPVKAAISARDPAAAAPTSPSVDPILEALGFPALPVVKRGKKRSLCTSLVLAAPSQTHGPTRTVWTHTVTATKAIECGTCTNLVQSTLPLHVMPVISFNTTVTADEPTTTTILVCSTAAGAPAQQSLSTVPKPTGRPLFTSADPEAEFEELTKTVTPQGILKPSCTTITELDPFIPDSTRTVYPGTVTSTTTLDCGSCELHWWTGVVNFFAPVIQTATITVDYFSVKADVTCSAVSD